MVHMQPQGCPLELLSSEVARVPFQLLREEGLLSDCVLDDWFLLVSLACEVFHGDLWEAEHLREGRVLLVRELCDVLLLDFAERVFLGLRAFELLPATLLEPELLV